MSGARVKLTEILVADEARRVLVLVVRDIVVATHHRPSRAGGRPWRGRYPRPGAPLHTSMRMSVGAGPWHRVMGLAVGSFGEKMRANARCARSTDGLHRGLSHSAGLAGGGGTPPAAQCPVPPGSVRSARLAVPGRSGSPSRCEVDDLVVAAFNLCH